MLTPLGLSRQYVAVISTLAVFSMLGGCGGGGGGGDSSSSTSSESTSSSGTSTTTPTTPGTSTSSGGTPATPTATALLVTPATGKASWNKSVTAEFTLKDASGNAVAGPFTCASDNTDNLTVTADCTTITGKRLGQQTITVSAGGVSGKATVKVIPQAQPIGTHGPASSFGGGDFNLVVTTDGRVLAWGANSGGALGQGTADTSANNLSLPTAVKDESGNGTLTGIVAVSAGERNGLALTEDGEVYSWGTNAWHQLGRTGDGLLPGKVLGPDGKQPLQHVVAVSMGEWNVVALTDDGTVYSWGTWTGDIATDHRAVALPVPAVSGNGNLVGAVAVSAGSSWSMALLGDGRIVTWGFVTSLTDALGHGAAAPEGDNPPGYVISKATGQPVNDTVSISAGWDFGLALSSSGTAYAWGEDNAGQTGQNTQYVWAFGAVPVLAPNGSGPLTGLVMIAAGGDHALALNSNGQVFSWGSNGNGVLGDGVTNPRGQQSSLPAPVVASTGLNQISNIVAISAGFSHSLALANDGTLLAWGHGFAHSLGQGTAGDADSYIPLAVKNEAGTGPLNLGPMSYWPNLTQRAR